MTQEHLESLKLPTVVYPERILFYRDGVSEGQYAQVLNEEVKSLKAGCAAYREGYAPTITMVIVQKRHHTRFMTASPQDADRSETFLLVLSLTLPVTHPTLFDFFLCSWRYPRNLPSTHYHVIYDDHKFTLMTLQMLSYNFSVTLSDAAPVPSQSLPCLLRSLGRFPCSFHFNDKKKFMPVSKSLARNMYFI